MGRVAIFHEHFARDRQPIQREQLHGRVLPKQTAGEKHLQRARVHGPIPTNEAQRFHAALARLQPSALRQQSSGKRTQAVVHHTDGRRADGQHGQQRHQRIQELAHVPLADQSHIREHCSVHGRRRVGQLSERLGSQDQEPGRGGRLSQRAQGDTQSPGRSLSLFLRRLCSENFTWKL